MLIAKFPGFGLLFARYRHRTLEMRFRFCRIRLRRHERNIAGGATNLGFPPSFLLKLANGRDAQLFGTALTYVAAMIVKTQFVENEQKAIDAFCSLLRTLVQRGVVTEGVSTTVGHA
jgi:hypothetical protein